MQPHSSFFASGPIQVLSDLQSLLRKAGRSGSLLFLFLLGMAITVSGYSGSVLAANAAGASMLEDHYIVKLKPDTNSATASAVMRSAKANGGQVNHHYRHVFNGFAAHLPTAALKGIRQHPSVVSVVQDQVVTLTRLVINKPCATPPCKGDGGGGGGEPSSQIVPTGITRSGAHLSSALAGNGQGSEDVDVAIIDTGISNHSDLTIAGGINCSTGPASKYNDGNGHGTHVAGTVAAKDNASGVVGMAPGARLWAVRVLNNAGSGSWGSIICGLDWVTANADVIEVANMSLGGSGSATGCSDGGLHEAVCATVAAGVTLVVAAGNESDNAANHVPAAYPEVITVSALADFDGLGGGLGSVTCRSDEDDTLANFSNFGADVDIIAPGVCIESTWNDGATNTISGTSMASPHVAGAAALLKARYPSMTPADVKTWLDTGNMNWNAIDDPDGMKEPLLDVSNF